MVKSSYFAGQCLSRRPGCPGPVQVFRSPDPWRRRTPSSSSHDPGWTAAAAAEAVYTRMIDQRGNFIILHLFQLRKHSFGHFILLKECQVFSWLTCDWTIIMLGKIYLRILGSIVNLRNFFLHCFPLDYWSSEYYNITTDDSERQLPSTVGLLFSVQ